MEKIVIVIAKMVKINILSPTSYCPRIFPDSTDFRFPIPDFLFQLSYFFQTSLQTIPPVGYIQVECAGNFRFI